MKRIAILGSTGSIGTQTLSVIEQFPESFQVVALSAGANLARLVQQAAQFHPEWVCIAHPEQLEALQQQLIRASVSPMPKLVAGTEGLVRLATLPDADTVVVGLVGFTGLLPSLEALKSGKQLLTANKETFVTAGHLVQPYLQQIIPLDSEHSAIFQCLQGCQDVRTEVLKLYLTASGGPFREYSQFELERVTVAQALKHPNWSMGDRVTIDSATMMNKGLEIIEAHHLFGLPFNRIDVVVHPESIVHSAVHYVDGSILAQMGQPDMRVPIQYGLTFPARWINPVSETHLDLAQLSRLHFEPGDPERFPCLRLARWAGETGGTLPVVLNAADEMAVATFLKEEIAFTEIPRWIEAVMQRHLSDWQANPTLERIIETDAWARQAFQTLLAGQPVLK